MQKCKRESAEYQAYLSYAERRSISMMKHQNAKMQKCKEARAESSLLELGLSFLKTMLYYHKNNVNLCISGTLISIYNHVFVTYHIN